MGSGNSLCNRPECRDPGTFDLARKRLDFVLLMAVTPGPNTSLSISFLFIYVFYHLLFTDRYPVPNPVLASGREKPVPRGWRSLEKASFFSFHFFFFREGILLSLDISELRSEACVGGSRRAFQAKKISNAKAWKQGSVMLLRN